MGRFDGEGGPADPIAGDLCEFLEHFIAAGMFNYGGGDRAHFDLYWKLIRDFVPFSIRPEDNMWLRHLDRRYDGDNTGVALS